MRRAARVLSATILAIVVAIVTGWTALALWYRLPPPDWGRGISAGIFVLFGLCVIIALFSRFRPHAITLFAAVFGAVLVWWSSIIPPDQANWAPDVSRQVTGTINDNLLTLTDVRDFEWRSDGEATPRWVTRSYDLAKLRTLDLFMSYWAGPQMAHVIMSFGFEGGDYLAWSVEVRRRKGEEFSPVADLFKSNPLVLVAADERDVVGLRSNIRGEDVQLYRMKTPPEAARKLLLEYVADANALATAPEFYNSITTNCSTTVVKMARAVGAKVPFDWRLIVNGYLPDYAYAQGALDTHMPLPELKALAHIGGRARAAGLSPQFSKLIRAGVPSPRDQPGESLSPASPAETATGG